MNPIYCNLIVTRRCNLRCKSCGVWKHISQELSTNEIKKVIEKIFEVIPPKIIGITGGEPLLRKDIFEIIEFISKKSLSVGINSNGTLPKNIYQKLLETSIDTIGISLHFISRNKQDEFSGVSGTWKKIVDNLYYLKDNNTGKFVYVQCTLTSYNYQEVLELKKFINNDIGLPFLIVPATWGQEEGIIRTKNKELANVERKEFEKIRKELTKFMGMRVLRNKTFLDIAFKQFLTGKKCWNCRAGELYFAVSPEGKFCICQDIETELSVLDEYFERKLRSKEMKRKIIELREKCSGCTYPCYLETQTIISHPWEAIPLALAYLYWKLRLKIKWQKI